MNVRHGSLLAGRKPTGTMILETRPPRGFDEAAERQLKLLTDTGISLSDCSSPRVPRFPHLDDWYEFQSILEELMDKNARDFYDIKKPLVTTIRIAIEALRQSVISLSDLEGRKRRISNLCCGEYVTL